MNDRTGVDLWVDVLARDRASLTVLGEQQRKCFDQPTLSDDLMDALESDALDSTAYGTTLFNALMPHGGDMRALYRIASEEAESKGTSVRFKLTLSLDLPEKVHRLCWERLYDPQSGSAIACDPSTAFSRYAPTGDASMEPIDSAPNLLVAIADPSNITRHNMVPIDREGMQQKLDRYLAPLAGQLRWQFLEPPVTAARIRSQLLESEVPFHALHLVAHGYVDPRIASGVLVLEQDNGTCDFLSEEVLPQVFLGLSDLRLLTLMTCDGANLSHAHPLSGLGRRLVRPKGLPAVISMQDIVSFQTAEQFSNAFYHQLCRHRGHVDAAVNEARLHLFLADVGSRRWSDPLLFMRLEDGALWRPRTEEPTTPRPAAAGRTTGVALPLPKTDDQPNGLFVGLGAMYGLPRLPHCADNARSLGALFATRDAAGTDFYARILSSHAYPKISRELLLQELHSLCETSNDNLVFFFSGYGVVEESGGYLVTEAGGETYQAVFLDELISDIQGSTEASITLLLECRRPPKNADLSKRISERPPIQLRKGLTLLACNARSQGIETDGFGLFTELLLNALDGAAADVRGNIWPAGVYSHAEPILRSWVYRPVFRTGGSDLPLRRCRPRVPTQALEQIPDLFVAAESHYQLTPSHEYSHRTSVPTDVRALNTLRILRNAGLVSVEKGKNLYFAALESRRVHLTRLGQLYWRLAKEDRL